MPISIEQGDALTSHSNNPFLSEKRLYEKETRSSDIPVTVVVPDFYQVALPNIGHQMVEHQVNQSPGFSADRSFLTSSKLSCTVTTAHTAVQSELSTGS